ncbi:MAG: 2-C-methyl-D-erythritol 2,4-cyclodiphosphate synthase [Gemmatimonadaceae bacterium]
MPREPRGASPPPADGANYRVGVGYDSHRFVSGRPLILGGILIPSDVGLLGHSDADAVCHALTDAILGAAALGDIGEMFPDSDPANKGRDSIGMLELAVKKVAASGYEVGQVDVSVIAESPRLSPYREKIRTRVASALGIESAQVSVKGKSNEGMGWVGRNEGLACIAVATLKRNR